MNTIIKTAKNRKLFTLFDLIIIALVLVVAFLSVFQFLKNSDLSAVVRENGKIVDTIKLSTVNNDFVRVYSEDYNVTVKFTKDGAEVVSSHCPDKLCVHSGKITRSGQSIVCLPAKISVSLESADENIDGVLR